MNKFKEFRKFIKELDIPKRTRRIMYHQLSMFVLLILFTFITNDSWMITIFASAMLITTGSIYVLGRADELSSIVKEERALITSYLADNNTVH